MYCKVYQTFFKKGKTCSRVFLCYNRFKFTFMHSDFIVLSNVFFLFPIIASLYKKEWIYCVISSTAIVTSFTYHNLRIDGNHLPVYAWARTADWFVALCAYGYMYYFIFRKARPKRRGYLTFLLTATLVFFFYGFLMKNYYETLHPWFHIAIGIVSGIIVLSRSPLPL